VRDALEQVFEGHDHQAWSLEELVERVRSKIGAGDYSTVFRAIGVLEGKGLVQRIDLGDHHEHVRCDVCGRVAEVQGCVVEGAATEIERSTGYRLTSHSLVFSGVCPECAGAAR
jgi:Fe2+ or Zn2+ uptake regulation protein